MVLIKSGASWLKDVGMVLVSLLSGAAANQPTLMNNGLMDLLISKAQYGTATTREASIAGLSQLMAASLAEYMADEVKRASLFNLIESVVAVVVELLLGRPSNPMTTHTQLCLLQPSLLPPTSPPQGSLAAIPATRARTLIQACLSLLATLSLRRHNLLCLREAGGVIAVSAVLLQGTYPDARVGALLLLRRMAVDGKSAADFGECGVVEHLSDRMGSEDPADAAESARTLCQLVGVGAGYERNTEILREHGGIAALVGLLESEVED